MAPPLARELLSPSLCATVIGGIARTVQEELLAQSRYVREPNFTSIHPDDLRFLFDAYDRRFFQGRYGEALNGSKPGFRFSRKMTTSAGTTSRLLNRVTGAVSFEIAIGIHLLYEGFKEGDRGVTVCGLECPTRLDALQRVFEHELIHLGEQLCWQSSNCGEPRFQQIAARWFLHSSPSHALITPRERAAEAGIRVGTLVEFVYQGRLLTGRVNRVNKSATVLVTDPRGALYKNGLRYLAYYVPVKSLRLAGAADPVPALVLR